MGEVYRARDTKLDRGGEEPGGVMSVTVLRTPKYERLWDDREPSLDVSHERFPCCGRRQHLRWGGQQRLVRCIQFRPPEVWVTGPVDAVVGR